MKTATTIFFLILFYTAAAQVSSVHLEQSLYYKDLGEQSSDGYDKMNGFQGKMLFSRSDTCSLRRMVFGYHPYWMGSAYLNYRWNLLSDLCYFSCEADPASGFPLDIHEWETSPVIDSALANGVRVHLCITLFSGHTVFLNSIQSMENFTHEAIALVKQRGAQGVNIDFEAVPTSCGDELMDFLAGFSSIFHDSIPGGLVSVAMPAVDWNAMWDIAFLNDYIDLYFIMGYEYYWPGSDEAGPVAPLYSMTSYYDYNLSRTVSYYQSAGMPLQKMVLGLPYYARQWKTESSAVPSPTLGSGVAYTYANIMNNGSGFYIPENRHWEDNSFSPYYTFYSNNAWYQCFPPDVRSMRYRYHIVNYRDLGGAGIWALGYDNGYADLWDLLRDCFTGCSGPIFSDTLYDSGGPSWNYYNDEEYTLTVFSGDSLPLGLDFAELSLENGYDSLWVYDGQDMSAPLLGAFSGYELPGGIHSTGNALTLRFYSDHNTVESGWKAIWHSQTAGVDYTGLSRKDEIRIYPNPAKGRIKIVSDGLYGMQEMVVRNMNGVVVFSEFVWFEQGEASVMLEGLERSGVYLLEVGERKMIFIEIR